MIINTIQNFSHIEINIRPGVLDEILKGLTHQPMQEVDHYFTEDVSQQICIVLYKIWMSDIQIHLYSELLCVMFSDT